MPFTSVLCLAHWMPHVSVLDALVSLSPHSHVGFHRPSFFLDVFGALVIILRAIGVRSFSVVIPTVSVALREGRTREKKQ